MKNILLPLLLAAILLSGWRLLEGNTVTCSVPLDYIRKAETSAVDPIVVTRARRDDSVRLVLPIGGTGTNAELYAASDAPIGTVAPMASASASGPGQHPAATPTLDMTGLKDGSYSLHYRSCGAGAVMNVVLVTREQNPTPSPLD